MSKRLNGQPTNTNQSTSASASGQFQSRPFTEQTESEQPSDEIDRATAIPDLQAQSASQSVHQFRQVPILQRQLTVGEPDDPYEQEADHVADQVMAMSVPPIQRETEDDELQMKPNALGLIQREQADEDELQMKPIAASLIQREQAEDDELQMKRDSGSIIGLIQREHTEDDDDALQLKPSLQQSETAINTTTNNSLETRLNQSQGSGSPLPDDVRSFMEPRFGVDFSQVRVHTGSDAVQLNRDLSAQAFAHKQNIYFGAGKSPGNDALTAHELTHVVQQTGNAQTKLIQRVIDPTYDVTHGEFQVNTTLGGSNLPIRIGFHPKTTAPYSNQISLIQIVRITQPDGTNVNVKSLPPGRGASLRTTADAATGVEGGYFTDALHTAPASIGGSGTTAAPGSSLPPQYPFNTSSDPAHPNPAQPNPATPGLSRPFSSGAQGAIVGYKRSDDPADIKAAELTDAPGYPSPTPVPPDINFNFETVAKGEDVMATYGALKWGFEIRSGLVKNEQATVQDAQSATFDAALERHRNFYVHEPVIFYFDFDSASLNASEEAKIDTFLAYLRLPQNADVKVTPTGFADRRGGHSAHNRDLARRRAQAVKDALRAKGIPDTQINSIASRDATEEFTPDATTNQDKDANRRGNRRVVLTFAHTPSTPGGGATP